MAATEPAAAPPPHSFKVTASVVLTSGSPARRGKRDRILTVELDTGAKLRVLLPNESADDAAVVAAVRAALKENEGWQGKTLLI